MSTNSSGPPGLPAETSISAYVWSGVAGRAAPGRHTIRVPAFPPFPHLVPALNAWQLHLHLA
jgi:hypothetical protein